MAGVTLESCRDIIKQFEPCPENKSKGVLGIDGEWGRHCGPAVLAGQWGVLAGNLWAWTGGLSGQLPVPHGAEMGGAEMSLVMGPACGG